MAPKTHVLGIRVTDEEHELLNRVAERDGMKTTAWVRAKIFGRGHDTQNESPSKPGRSAGTSSRGASPAPEPKTTSEHMPGCKCLIHRPPKEAKK